MKLKAIKTEAEYEAALAYVAALMDAKPGSAEKEKLDLLPLLMTNYEQEHFHIAAPNPVDALRFRLEQDNPPERQS